MPRYSALVLAFVLVTSVHAIPLDEIAARDGVGIASTDVGGQTDGGSVAGEAASCSSTDCAVSKHFNESVFKVASENVGNRGDASSGAANEHSLLRLIGGSNSTNSTDEAPQGSGSSGAGGETTGGSIADNRPALIELDSDNAGQGGSASSGNRSGLVNQLGDVGQKEHKILTS